MPSIGFRCCHCKELIRLSARVWVSAYRKVLDHVSECAPKAGAGYDEMREYISAVMADWPALVERPARR